MSTETPTKWEYRDGERTNWERILVDGETAGDIWKDGAVWNANGLAHYATKREAAQAVADRSYHGHRVNVTRRAGPGRWRGAGPRWVVRVNCTCGYRSHNVAGDAAWYARDHVKGASSG